MTTDSPSRRSDSGPSIHVIRARKLLYAGLAGGLAATLICLVVFTVKDGARGLGSAALGAGMVLFFYAVGQSVMVAFANAGARTLMSVSMASYTGRVVILGLILMIVNKYRDSWHGLDAITVFITVIAVVAGWLIVEVVMFTRLRIGAYDQGYNDPVSIPDEARPDRVEPHRNDEGAARSTASPQREDRS
jgi:hypothetical protein